MLRYRIALVVFCVGELTAAYSAVERNQPGERSGDILCGEVAHTAECQAYIETRSAVFEELEGGAVGGERIINGSDEGVPNRCEFPFMVNIKTGWQHWCGGAVYDKNHVISAAHCFYEGQDLKLFFADLDQKKGPGKGEVGQEKRYVTNVTTHPEYDSTWFKNDIAVLTLDSPLPFTEDNMIRPICMPTIEVQGGEDTIVMGWGYTYDTNNENILNMAHVPVIPRETCQQRDWYSVAVTENMICAGFEEGAVDACQGDSGGPLVLQNPATGRYELTGVVSWGAGCAKPKAPGVYTDVLDYIDWIKEVAGEPQYY